VVVRAVPPGGPAQRAGMRPGDRITHVDGQAVADLGGQRVLELLMLGFAVPSRPFEAVAGECPASGPPPASLTLTVERPGVAAPLTFELRPCRYKVEAVLGVSRGDDHSWEYFADRRGRLAHVRVAAFSQGCAEELRVVVRRLIEEGARGLVLDLRWCPGGYLDEAVETARLFLPEGVVATVKNRRGDPQVFRATGEDAVLDLPLVVLVNGETMGGPELVTAALQDARRAVVVGQRTVGKASVQTPLHIDVPGVGLRLTSGTFQRPNGKGLNRFPDSRPGDDWGVRPDVDARLSPELSRRLKEDWLRQTLRPGPCRAVLPLDRADADPQQAAALAALRRLIAGRSEAE
jgi:carboxyl-terminal processing protease